MKLLLILVLAFGLANAAGRGFLQNTPEVQAATLNFIQEYNRLAKLAADAPDIDIYHNDNRLQRVDIPRQQTTRPHAFNPLAGSTVYSFTANLGGNRQFHPHQIRTFHQPQHLPQHVTQFQPVVRSVFAHQPVQTHVQSPKWHGPLADTIPAGVNGLPQQVGFTPEVAAARNAHFQALLSAFQNARQQHG
ncbi:UNVERIFIED_CONTAM: hypothetical protein RMT77_009712 [Armadillidium vulgare]